MNRLSRLVFIVLILLYSIFGDLQVATAAIPVSEREALIALYNSTDGDNWTNNSGWKTPPLDTDGFAMPGTENSWYGVSAYNDRVTSVDLSSNQLTGNIPVELMNLTSLEYLNVCNNDLFATDSELRDFLGTLQPEWEDCQGCADTDDDGICDVEDNCPYTYNPGQEDIDEDGYGDACTYSYYLPYFVSGSEYWYGVALRNSSGSQDANVSVIVFDQTGSIVTTEGNTIPARGQDAWIVGRELEGEGWVMVSSDQPLTGLCFIGEAENITYMADITLIQTLSLTLDVPHVAQYSQWDTAVLVCNPNNISTEVTLTFVDTQGNALYTDTHDIAAYGSGRFELVDLVEGVGYSNGSVEIDADQGVAAFALYNNLKRGGYSFAGISAVDPGEVPAGMMNYEYYLPYFISGSEYWYGVGLRNSHFSQDANVLVEVYDQFGNLVTTEGNTLPARGQDAWTVGDGLEGEGWVRVSSDQPLTGLCFIGEADNITYMADITLIPTLSETLDVPHVAQYSQWDTAILVCNPNSISTTVTLTFVDAQGNALYTDNHLIPGNGSGRYELFDLVEGNDYTNGSVEIDADQGVAAFALYNNLKWGGYCFAGISAVDPGISRYGDLPPDEDYAELTEIQFEANGFTFDALIIGPADGEPVLFLHGFPDTMWMWEGVMEELADNGYRCLAPNQRGYSPGARPTELNAYEYDELIADGFAFADEMLGEKFHLIAHDWGANIAWLMVERDPSRIASFVPIAVPHYRVWAALALNVDGVDVDNEMGIYRNFLLPMWMEEGTGEESFNEQGLRDLWPDKPADQLEKTIDIMTEPGAMTAALNWYRANGGHQSVIDDYNEDWEVSNPTLLIFGSEDMGQSSVTSSAPLMTGPYTLLQPAGSHFIVDEKPDEVTAGILAHLQENPMGGDSDTACNSGTPVLDNHPPPAEDYTEEVGGVYIDMVYIPGGTFTLGCEGGSCPANTSPVPDVTVSSYHIARNQVTAAMWEAVMGESSGGMVSITWYDAMRFACELSHQTGRAYRMMTEAEFEYAAKNYLSGLEDIGEDSMFGEEWAYNSWDQSHMGGTDPVGPNSGKHTQKTRRDIQGTVDNITGRLIRSIDGIGPQLRLVVSNEMEFPPDYVPPCELCPPVPLEEPENSYRDPRWITGSGAHWKEGALKIGNFDLRAWEDGTAVLNGTSGQWFTSNNIAFVFVPSSGSIKKFAYIWLDETQGTLISDAGFNGGYTGRIEKVSASGNKPTLSVLKSGAELAAEAGDDYKMVDMENIPEWAKEQDQRLIDGPGQCWFQDNSSVGALHHYRKDVDADEFRFTVNQGQMTMLANGDWFTVNNTFLRITHSSGYTTDYLYTLSPGGFFFHNSYQAYERADFRLFQKKSNSTSFPASCGSHCDQEIPKGQDASIYSIIGGGESTYVPAPCPADGCDY